MPMTRRLTLAIVLTTLAALVLAGLGTVVLAQAAARRDLEADLRRQATELVTGFQDVASDARPDRPIALARTIERVLDLDGFAVMAFGPRAGTRDTPPDGLTVDDLEPDRLAAGEVVSGHRGSLVFAAAPTPATERGFAAAVLTQDAGRGTRPAVGWLLVGSALALGIAGAVAVVLGRRLTRPVREASAATERIAAGNLSVRLPEPRPDQHDELAELARSINAMATELERSRGLEQQFLLSVSHDLRTPLTSIRGYAEAIADGATSDPQWAAGVILVEARRLERLVRDLLDLARLQTRAFSLDVRPIVLGDVVADAVEALQPHAERAGVALGVETAPVTVQGDRDRVAQVVTNLVENAVRYARRHVWVTVVADGAYGVVQVDDDGPGIAPADRPHVFERLYVARHEPVRKESGSGLGLAIVHELATALGGSAAANAAPGGGARLTVRLPRTTTLPPPAGTVVARERPGHAAPQ